MPISHQHPLHAAQPSTENGTAFWLEANAAVLEGMTRMAALNGTIFADSFKNGSALLHACMNPYFSQEVLSWMLRAPVDIGGLSSYRRHAADIISETWEKTARMMTEESGWQRGNIEKELALTQFANAPMAGWAKAGTEVMNMGYSVMAHAARQMADSLRRGP